MSVIFGLRPTEKGRVDWHRLISIAKATERFAPDAIGIEVAGSVGMAFQLYSTSARDRISRQPRVGSRGHLIAFDGRLDNAAELTGLLGLRLSEAADTEIVLAAFERWGESCFSQLVGDWALALWSPACDALYLARDHAGTRSLFYSIDEWRTIWSSCLETFFTEGRGYTLNPEFAARYLAALPIGSLTPYEGINEVPAGHYLRLGHNSRTLVRHWDPLTNDRIHYGLDIDYERHLLSLLERAIARRSIAGEPVIAQLSGGMDSTTIVTVSDRLRREADVTDLLDTVSLIDSTEPSWNEAPYIAAVEGHRGKPGIHIERSFLDVNFEAPQERFHYPGTDASVVAADLQFEERLGRGRYRAVLSGIGGDELLGGPANPLPELADLFAARQWRSFSQQGVAWATSERTSLWHLLPGAARFTRFEGKRVQGWSTPPWVKVGEKSLSRPCVGQGYWPSAVDRLETWDQLLETLPHRFPSSVVRYEYRYPLLDRDLVDFLLRVPPQQIRRPGERRSLMRRTLSQVLPAEILARTRKASLQRGPLMVFGQRRQQIAALLANSLLEQAGYIDAKRLLSTIDQITMPELRHLRPVVMRALQLEIWLKREDTARRWPTPPPSSSIAVGRPDVHHRSPMGRTGFGLEMRETFWVSAPLSNNTME